MLSLFYREHCENILSIGNMHTTHNLVVGKRGVIFFFKNDGTMTGLPWCKQKSDLSLTYIRLASFLWDINKQCRPRSDATERGVLSGILMFAYIIFH